MELMPIYLRNRRSDNAIYCAHCGGKMSRIGSINNYTRVDMRAPYKNNKRVALDLELCNECREKLFLFMTTDISNHMSYDDLVKEQKQLDTFLMSLSGRACGVILRSNITLNKILDYTYDDLMSIRNCGEKTAKEIMGRIKEYRNGEIL